MPVGGFLNISLRLYCNLVTKTTAGTLALVNKAFYCERYDGPLFTLPVEFVMTPSHGYVSNWNPVID